MWIKSNRYKCFPTCRKLIPLRRPWRSSNVPQSNLKTSQPLDLLTPPNPTHNPTLATHGLLHFPYHRRLHVTRFVCFPNVHHQQNVQQPNNATVCAWTASAWCYFGATTDSVALSYCGHTYHTRVPVNAAHQSNSTSNRTKRTEGAWISRALHVVSKATTRRRPSHKPNQARSAALPAPIQRGARASGNVRSQNKPKRIKKRACCTAHEAERPPARHEREDKKCKQTAWSQSAMRLFSTLRRWFLLSTALIGPSTVHSHSHSNSC